MFTEPINAASYDDMLTVIELWFQDGPDQLKDANWPSGKFLMRGGICWPAVYNTETKAVEGFAVLVGYNLGTDRLFVFDETSFACISHIIDPETRAILFTGLAPWFGKAWSRYLCDSYYTNQSDDICRRWESEVHADAGIQPAPRFIPCQPWDDVAAAEALIWDWITRRRMGIWSGEKEELYPAITQWKRGEFKKLSAPLVALAAALTGLIPNVAQAKDVASSPDARIRRIGNAMMKQHPRDWHDPE